MQTFLDFAARNWLLFAAFFAVLAMLVLVWVLGRFLRGLLRRAAAWVSPRPPAL